MGIDLALRNTGILILSEGGHVLRHSTIHIVIPRRRVKKRKGEKNPPPPIPESTRIERLLNIANEVVGFAREYGIHYIAMEGFAYEAALGAHQLGEVSGVVKSQLWLALRIVPHVVPPSTGRKSFFGRGNAKKADIFKIITEELDIGVANDHESDAYVSARWLWNNMAVEVD